MKFWDFLNGKKTVIGGAVMLFVKLAPFIGVPADVAQVVDEIATAILALGLTHKAVKSAS